MTGEQKPGGLEAVAWLETQRHTGEIRVALKRRADSPIMVSRWATIPLTPAEPAEARVRELAGERDTWKALAENAAQALPQYVTRATAAEAKLARAVEGLQRMEWACEQLASTRSSAAYEQMISDGQAQGLLELDNARREARQTLAALQEAGEVG